MSKNDNIDYEIIKYLMIDGRMSCAEIARKIEGTSERSVRYRIDRLIKNGVIQVSAIVSPKAVGFSVIADVLLVVESDSILEVATTLTKFDEVSYVACSIGETDISIQVVGHSNDDIYRFVTEVIGKVPGVRKTTTSIVPMVLKDVYQWHIPKK